MPKTKEEELQYQREWRAKNREHVNKRQRGYYHADPEKFREISREKYRRRKLREKNAKA